MKEYYWLAVNGASVAMANCPFPPSEFRVSPTPEQLLGFVSLREAQRMQQFLLTAPIREVGEYMAAGGHLGDLPTPACVLRPSEPQPPTRGPTAWILAKDLEEAGVER